jgi:hypothetical protein
MLPDYRERFNAAFTPEKYAAFLAQLEAKSGTPQAFRHSETPCFFPTPLVEAMAGDGGDLIRQLTTPEYQQIAKQAVPPQYDVPGEPGHPLFIQVDFGRAWSRFRPSHLSTLISRYCRRSTSTPTNSIRACATF